MSYTSTTTYTKTSQTPTDIDFKSMPSMSEVLTPDEYLSYKESYPAKVFTEQLGSNMFVVVRIFASKEIYDASIIDPINTKFVSARNQWLQTNFIESKTHFSSN